MRRAIGQDFRLNLTRQNRIGRLQRSDRRDGLGTRHLRRIEVGNANPADLAFFFQLRHGRPAFFDIFIRLRPVHLIQVDAFDVEPTQACFAFAADGVGLQTLADLAILTPDTFALGEHVRLWTEARQRLRHHFFRMAEAVNCRRVHPVDSRLHRRANRGNRIEIVLRTPPESPITTAHCPRAHSEARDVQIAVA